MKTLVSRWALGQHLGVEKGFPAHFTSTNLRPADERIWSVQIGVSVVWRKKLLRNLLLFLPEGSLMQSALVCRPLGPDTWWLFSIVHNCRD